MTYTIKAALPSGKDDPKYGKEYIVQVEEDSRTFKVNRKDEPKVGDTLDGEIVDGKYGAYFKKSALGTPYPVKGGGKPYDSDGQRQGMCINNAAAYVNTMEFLGPDGKPGPLTDKEWAETVHSYAQALYRIGDLTPSATEQETIADKFKEE